MHVHEHEKTGSLMSRVTVGWAVWATENQLMMPADLKGGEEDRGPRGDGGCQNWR